MPTLYYSDYVYVLASTALTCLRYRSLLNCCCITSFIYVTKLCISEPPRLFGLLVDWCARESTFVKDGTIGHSHTNIYIYSTYI